MQDYYREGREGKVTVGRHFSFPHFDNRARLRGDKQDWWLAINDYS
jgi:hypothetical protein